MSHISISTYCTSQHANGIVALAVRLISEQRNISADFNKLIDLQLTSQDNKDRDTDLQRAIPSHPPSKHPVRCLWTSFTTATPVMWKTILFLLLCEKGFSIKDKQQP